MSLRLVYKKTMVLRCAPTVSHTVGAMWDSALCRGPHDKGQRAMNNHTICPHSPGLR